jgi:oligoendopeptidase F
VEQDLQELDQILVEVAILNEQLASSADIGVAQKLALHNEAAGNLLANVSTYARCLLSVDTQDEAAQTLSGRLQSYQKRFGNLFEPWSLFLDEADEATLDQYLIHPETSASAFMVRHQRQRGHENLSLNEENLVHGLAQDGVHAWSRLHDQLAGALACEVMVGNETQTMGVAQASGLLTSPDDVQRQAAWSAINAAWEVHEESCAASINAISGWRLEMCEQRSRQRPVHFLDAPVHMNRITRQTLDTLMGVARDARPLAQRAAALQARAYGKQGFGPWDVRAPAPSLGDAGDAPLRFDEAVDVIANAYGEVDGDMESFVRMMVENNWIEGTVGPHKAPGAYCTRFAKSRTPRVYMTFTGGKSDVITLAHELGHALHNWVMRDLPESQRSYGMSLAETASTFGETLVRDALLLQAQSPQDRLNILWEDVSALTSFLLNIPARFEFEQAFYEMRKERPLRPQELKDLMSQAWRTWYGDALAEPDPMFWASKLHFYIAGLSFYNFPYLFGYLFSLGVYARRNQSGDAFYPRYLALLRDTGRMTAEDVAAEHLQADLREVEFWQSSIDSLAAKVDAFENLLNELGR